jgi:hypothetical protein
MSWECVLLYVKTCRNHLPQLYVLKKKSRQRFGQNGVFYEGRTKKSHNDDPALFLPALLSASQPTMRIFVGIEL